MLSFWTDTVTAVIPARRESQIHLVSLDWTNAVRVPITHCSFQPTGSSDSGGNETYDAELFIAKGFEPVGFNEDCKVEWEGETYVVSGRPLRRRSPSGAVSHTHVRLVSENSLRVKP